MENSLAKVNGSSHRVIAETRPTMLKADLRKTDSRDYLEQLGGCLDYARREAGWTLDQLAAALDRDPRQVRRWIAGEERTQVDVVWSVEVLRQPFVIGLARMAECEIETVVKIRRSA